MKRGRASSNELAVIPLPTAARRLDPPSHLTQDEASLFREVVASCPPTQFVASDLPTVVAYIQAILTARRSMRGLTGRKLNPMIIQLWDRAVKQQAMLATKLRLAPQSRVDPKVLGRRAANHRPSAYDQMEDE